MAKWTRREVTESEKDELIASGKGKNPKFDSKTGKLTLKVRVDETPKTSGRSSKTEDERPPLVHEVEIYKMNGALYWAGKSQTWLSTVIGVKRLFSFLPFKPWPRAYYHDHLIQRTDKKGKKYWVAVHNLIDAPALTTDVDKWPNGEPPRAQYSEALAGMLGSDTVIQLGAPLETEVSFFTGEVKRMLIVAFVLGLMIGVPIVNILHLIPASAVTWVT